MITFLMRYLCSVIGPQTSSIVNVNSSSGKLFANVIQNKSGMERQSRKASLFRAGMLVVALMGLSDYSYAQDSTRIFPDGA